MNFRIDAFDDESGDILRSLRQWFRGDDGMRTVDVVDVIAPLKQGDMSGGVIKALEVAVLNKDVLAALSGALGGWLVARSAARRTKIRVRSGDLEIEIDSTKLRDPSELVRQLRLDLEALRQIEDRQ